MLHRFTFIFLSLCTATMASAPATLDTMRWHHRILVVPSPTAEMESQLEEHRASLDERDLILIRLYPDAPATIDAEIAERFKLTAESKEILLIGKDGRTTVRWPVDDFTFATLFSRIDAMPMRQREMRQRE